MGLVSHTSDPLFYTGAEERQHDHQPEIAAAPDLAAGHGDAVLDAEEGGAATSS